MKTRSTVEASLAARPIVVVAGLVAGTKPAAGVGVQVLGGTFVLGGVCAAPAVQLRVTELL